MPSHRAALPGSSGGRRPTSSVCDGLLTSSPQISLDAAAAHPPANADQSRDQRRRPVHEPSRRPLDITTLPAEVIHEIADLLHPVGRVCLALSCKPVALAILSAPRLTPTTWSRFTDRRYDWLVPESYSPILRLAHGWIPKAQWRYCCKCHRIRPRDPAYFQQRLPEWEQMTKKQQYAFLIDTWSASPLEDSSCLYCDHCRAAYVKAGDNQRLQPVHCRDPAQCLDPVQCPECLERELTDVWDAWRSANIERTPLSWSTRVEFTLEYIRLLGVTAGQGLIRLCRSSP